MKVVAALLVSLALTSALPAFEEIKAPTEGKKWALLIAGSNTWGNYRHQADIYHSYQIMKAGGLADENIIVFHYDDIANNSENPKKGTIINNPTGSDVYAGVPKDYTGAEVTADNFLAALAGDKTAVKGGSGKVLATGPNDHVFVYYADHGGAGILGMPEGQSFLYGKDIVATLKKKAAAGGFKQMTFYIEACESGSIFSGTLPANLKIYATTASNPSESSWGCYCPGMAQPPPEGYNTCLGDLYSVAWMENTDAKGRMETLEKQYTLVKQRVSQNGTFQEGSHVMQYGETDFDTEDLDVFIGDTSNPNFVVSDEKIGTVDNRDAELLWMGLSHPEMLKEELAFRATLDVRMGALAALAGEKAHDVMTTVKEGVVEDWDCYKANIDAYTATCSPLRNYGMKHAKTLANLCNEGVSPAAVQAKLEQIC